MKYQQELKIKAKPRQKEKSLLLPYGITYQSSGKPRARHLRPWVYMLGSAAMLLLGGINI